jgi:hypothetical protein
MEEQKTKVDSQITCESSSYFLCSVAVVEHFPNLTRSDSFKSGYEWDKDDYFIISTEYFKAIDEYYNSVIIPFNEKSTVDDIDFWLREICDSQLNDAPRNCIMNCKRYGVFRAIEKIYGLTAERNIAYAIFKMANNCGLNPIEFIKKVSKNGKTSLVHEKQK